MRCRCHAGYVGPNCLVSVLMVCPSVRVFCLSVRVFLSDCPRHFFLSVRIIMLDSHPSACYCVCLSYYAYLSTITYITLISPRPHFPLHTSDTLLSLSLSISLSHSLSHYLFLYLSLTLSLHLIYPCVRAGAWLQRWLPWLGGRLLAVLLFLSIRTHIPGFWCHYFDRSFSLGSSSNGKEEKRL